MDWTQWRETIRKWHRGFPNIPSNRSSMHTREQPFDSRIYAWHDKGIHTELIRWARESGKSWLHLMLVSYNQQANGMLSSSINLLIVSFEATSISCDGIHQILPLKLEYEHICYLVMHMDSLEVLFYLKDDVFSK